MTLEIRRGDHEEHRPVLPPDRGGDRHFNVAASPRTDDRPLFTVEFTDAAGKRWRREPTGELNMVSKSA